jgi:G protein beta subunit-like protein
MYSGGYDETVKIWDIRSSADYQRDFNHQSPVTCVALHPNQGELISGDQDGRIVRWDLRENQCTWHVAIPSLPSLHCFPFTSFPSLPSLSIFPLQQL